MDANGICSFQTFWSPFIRFFQFLCISHYKLLRSDFNKNIFKRFIFPIHFIFFSIFRIGIFWYIILEGFQVRVESETKHNDGRVMFYLDRISIFVYFLTNAIGHVETFIKGNSEMELFKKIEEIHSVHTSKLKYSVNYNEIQRRCLFDAVNTFAVSASIAIINLITLTSSDHIYMKFYFVLAIIISYGRICQIAIVLHFMCACVNHLQTHLKLHQLDPGNQSLFHRLKEIKHFRDIYSTIWLIKNLISDCYGWSLIVFLVQFILDMINFSYRTYRNLIIIKSDESSLCKEN